MNRLLKFSFFAGCFYAAFAASAALAAQPPSASAGPDLFLNSNQSAILQGSAYDPDGGILNYHWSCDGGTLSSYNIVQPAYTAPSIIAFNPQAVFACTFTATGQSGLSNSDTAKIYVNYGGTGAITEISAQTSSATNVYSNQATLNGSFSSYSSNIAYVWFQYGQSSNYGQETSRQSASGTTGSFSQNVSELYLNATYHFRAVAQDSSGNRYYGQNMTFLTTNPAQPGNTYLSVQKRAINPSLGNLSWVSQITAVPGNILSFAITLQPGASDVHNVHIKDTLSANLIYKGNLMLNIQSYPGDITQGINIGTVYANQPVVVSYQAQVAPSSNFAYGVTALSNSVTVSSAESGTQSALASVLVSNSAVSGATIIATGAANNFLVDSFFLPLFLIVLMSYLYFSGKIYRFADWLKARIN